VSFPFPRGLSGGSSAVNTRIALRDIAYDYDEWVRARAPRSGSPERCLPAFKQLETDSIATTNGTGKQADP
jgi:hypothetical protein